MKKSLIVLFLVSNIFAAELKVDVNEPTESNKAYVRSPARKAPVERQDSVQSNIDDRTCYQKARDFCCEDVLSRCIVYSLLCAACMCDTLKKVFCFCCTKRK